jgi:predicted unusual protein kinase regulating ubiquinone biosynthesis (AarF/ABC1/UbiB family)
MFSQFIKQYMRNYRIEAENLLTIKDNLKYDADMIITTLIIELTSQHVGTMECQRLFILNLDREKLVRIHHVFFKMLLRHSIFRADLHPGNISIAW